MRRLTIVAMVGAVLCQACSVTLTEKVPASELDMTERSSFTADGRLFVIGVRPDGRADAGPWLVELSANGEGGYLTKNLVAGALQGTADGRIGGAPLGEPCAFSGMKAQGTRIYAGCVSPTSLVAALLEIDVAEGTVRAGNFTSCNGVPSVTPCTPMSIYPNGMAIDDAGRIYVTNMLTHLSIAGDVPSISVEGTGSIEQITIDRQASAGGTLVFTHRPWFSADIVQDGIGPNGVQIEGSVLYYAAGPNINRVDIDERGNAGAASVHYAGPSLSYIDDFAVLDGRMALARTIPPAIVALDRAEPFGTARELGTRDMELDQIPSSITYQADNPAGRSVFPASSLVVTCFFGGGIYALTGVEP